ncbi:hypothetical protein AB433_14165 [Croceicoccus naphthovorans]|uniref:Gamma-glutamylcyclotransferase AIG2-like domain-containing protein n=2 Tax=Croceicoccus naphthovorans TaxID=1348774 RepID=A0A0G3XKV0_9SPHN|nr:hypothetical protein AB433_14165 [Croceicoccus naphthovorans]
MQLFLYGTLMGEADTAKGRWLHERVSQVQPATVPGVIYAIPSTQGWYPALLRGPGRVRGVVAECALERRDVARLDRYEGHEYRRKAMRARTADGTTVAQAWIWRGPLPKGAVAIADGDFLGWLANSGNAILNGRNGF